jgi:hypothetical protein
LEFLKEVELMKRIKAVHKFSQRNAELEVELKIGDVQDPMFDMVPVVLTFLVGWRRPCPRRSARSFFKSGPVPGARAGTAPNATNAVPAQGDDNVVAESAGDDEQCSAKRRWNQGSTREY